MTKLSLSGMPGTRETPFSPCLIEPGRIQDKGDPPPLLALSVRESIPPFPVVNSNRISYNGNCHDITRTIPVPSGNTFLCLKRHARGIATRHMLR